MTILPKKKNNSLNKDSRSNQCSSPSSGGVDRPSAESVPSVSSSSVAHHRRHYLIERTEPENVSQTCASGVAIPHRKRAAIGQSIPGITPTSKNNGNNSGGARPKIRSTCVKGSPSSSDNKDAENSVGYNSEDEYERSAKGLEFSDELERKFEDKVRKVKGYTIKKMKEDGACMFRAVADQIYGDQEMHGVVRKLCMDYMAKNADHFSQFVTEDFNTYVARKRVDSVHGNHAEIQALAEIFSRPIEVYQYSLEPINIFYTMNTSSPKSEPSAPIRVTYHRNMHYNSLVDPYAATIGVGLGLPQFYPGSADKTLLKDVEKASEQDEIERAMLKDKLRATDWEATDEQIQEEIARESYLEWIRAQEIMKENNRGESTVTKPHTKPKSPPQATTNSTLPHVSSAESFCPSFSHVNTRSSSTKYTNAEKANQTDQAEAGPSHRVTNEDSASRASSSSYLYDESMWMTEEEDSHLLNQVLALSQREYFESLKKSSRQDGDGAHASDHRTNASSKEEHNNTS